MNFWEFTLIGGILTSAQTVDAREITETLQTPIRATLQSSKKPYELEVCVADGITQIGSAVPVALRDGPENVMVLGYQQSPKLIVTLTAHALGTRIDVRTKSGNMDDKLARAIKESCGLRERD